MARPRSEGFPYYPQDTDAFSDPKVRGLLARFGCDGYALLAYITQAAFAEHGYYVEWDEDRTDLVRADLGISAEKTGLIVAYLCKRSLLESKSLHGITVLTSHQIQKRFQEMARASKRGFYDFLPEVWLLGEEYTLRCIFCTQNDDNSGINPLNSGIKPFNSGIIAQRKEKENKKNEIKENKNKAEERKAGEARNMAAYRQFEARMRFGRRECEAYSAAEIAAVDWAAVSAAVSRSAALQAQRSPGFFIRHAHRIIGGEFADEALRR